LDIKAALLKIAGSDCIKFNEPMKKHTTFRVGGSAEIFITPKDYNQIPELIHTCYKSSTPFYLIGNGSNTIVKDSGFKGVIIKTNNLSKISITETKVTAQCGVLLPVLSQHALRAELTGMEFLSGVPGTVGGAVCMNAGAYGSEICSIIDSVKILDSNCNIKELKRDEINFSYRHTDLQDKDAIVLEVSFNLSYGNPDEIKAYMETLKKKRQTTQPLEYPNAGSIFKKCGEHPAGCLIDRAGLKGFSIGGAEISQKHANFIVNKNNATASDVIELIDYTRNVVQDRFNLTLETEVIILG
jgi:UDP-N-acetylmuramate dehydrogenase